MLSLGKSVLLYNKVDTFEIVKEKVEAVSSSQILEVANEIFNEDNLSHLIYKV
jgi:predicted Zn-dependent peptidase